MDKEQINKIVNEAEAHSVKNILVIKAKDNYDINENDETIELNNGYEFDVDGSLPEIADGIAKFAKELPKNGFGDNSDSYFLELIKMYFDKQ